MNSKFKTCINNTKRFMSKHSPEILTGIGVASLIGSTVLAVGATPKALALIEDKKEELEVDELTIKETVTAAWKPYIPAVLTGVAGVTCIVGASAVNAKRNAALAAAYSISERALVKYRDKVIETIGEKKHKEIKEKIAQDDIDERPVNKSQIYITSKGNTLCRDSISGRDFRSDVDTIRGIVNELNREMTYNQYVSLDEYYNKLGLESIKNSSRLGWNLDDGLLELELSTCLTQDNEPCVVIDISIPPRYDFDKLM